MNTVTPLLYTRPLNICMFLLLLLNSFFVYRVKTLKAFIQAFVNGELEPFIKSEDIPASNDGPVKVNTLSKKREQTLFIVEILKLIFNINLSFIFQNHAVLFFFT